MIATLPGHDGVPPLASYSDSNGVNAWEVLTRAGLSIELRMWYSQIVGDSPVIIATARIPRHPKRDKIIRVSGTNLYHIMARIAEHPAIAEFMRIANDCNNDH